MTLNAIYVNFCVVLLAIQMGSYDHIMPESATRDHQEMQAGVDASKMVASEDPAQGCLLPANSSSIHKTADRLQMASDLKVTSDGNLHNQNNSTQNSPQNDISGAAKRRMKPRSVSESECENFSRSILPRFNRKDEGNDCKTPVDNSDLQPLNDDFDALPFPNQVKLPVPPDGGWGWVIVAVSFVCCAVVDGLCSVFGVLLPDLVIYFEETSSKVSLAGSVLAGGFLLSGNVLHFVRFYCLCCLSPEAHF